LDNKQIIVSHFKELNRDHLQYPYLEICNTQDGLKPNGFSLYDSTFLNTIAEKNKSYCELSALYSVWKDNLFKDYIGLAHYRRFFVFQNLGVHSVQKKFNSLIEDCSVFSKTLETLNYDLIVPIPLNFSGWEHNSIYKHFSALHPNLIDLFIKGCTILDSYLGKNNFSFNWLNSNYYLYPYNMFFGKKEIVEKWCNIIFSVLFELENQSSINLSGYDSRWAGFLSERFFSLFVQTQCSEYSVFNSTVAFYQ